MHGKLVTPFPSRGWSGEVQRTEDGKAMVAIGKILLSPNLVRIVTPPLLAWVPLEALEKLCEEKVFPLELLELETMIHVNDIVRLKHTHSWRGQVLRFEGEEALVMRLGGREPEWMPLEFLELNPGQEEEVLA